jgi:BirA family transcriptional regulator, biotin operon repressor / biotin---[acetyl-CoA-carboxylase] ligase
LRKETTNLAEFYFTEVIDCFTICYSPQCPSTSALAKDAVIQYPGLGSILVYTFHQTKGRGQGNNKWESEPGKNLAFTLAINVTNTLDLMIGYNKAITLGVRDGIAAVSEMKAEIKWPNDILLNNTKMAGLLMETWKHKDQTYLLCGIGLNINQIVFGGEFSATSLAIETGDSFELLKVLKEVIHCICKYINNINFSTINYIASDFNKQLWKLNYWIWFENEDGTVVEGKILEVDEFGRIVFEDKTLKINKLHHGQVKIAKNNFNFFKG